MAEPKPHPTPFHPYPKKYYFLFDVGWINITNADQKSRRKPLFLWTVKINVISLDSHQMMPCVGIQEGHLSAIPKELETAGCTVMTWYPTQNKLSMGWN
jgi:hypothetical protein